MAHLAHLNFRYLDESFIAEAKVFGGIHFCDELRQMGYSGDAKSLQKSIDNFKKQRNVLTDKPLLRQQKNSSSRFDCVIFSPSRSVRVYLSALPESARVKKEAVLRAAYAEGAKFIASNEFVRQGAGGVNREPAQGLYFIAMHGSTRSQQVQSYDHAHVVYMNTALKKDGQTQSVDGSNRVSKIREADLRFHLELAQGLEKEFGVKCDFKAGKCEIPGVTQHAIETCTGSKAREIDREIRQAGVENTPRNRRLANDILRTHSPKFIEHDVRHLKESWRQAAIGAQPTILSDVKYQKGQNQTRMQELAALEMPRVESFVAKPEMSNRQEQVGDWQRVSERSDNQSIASSLLQRTQQDQEKKAGAQRRDKHEQASKLTDAAKNLFTSQARSSHEKKAGQQQEQQKSKEQANSNSRKRPDFDFNERVRSFNSAKQAERTDFLKRQKSWLGQQWKESIKTLRTIVQARFRREQSVVKVHNIDAFIEKTSKRSIAEGHRAARKAVRSTRVKSFKHALEVAQEGYRQGRKPKLILPKKTDIVLGKGLKLTQEQYQALQKLKSKYNLRFHQERKRDIDLKSITVVNEAQQQRSFSQ